MPSPPPSSRGSAGIRSTGDVPCRVLAGFPLPFAEGLGFGLVDGLTAGEAAGEAATRCRASVGGVATGWRTTGAVPIVVGDDAPCSTGAAVGAAWCVAVVELFDATGFAAGCAAASATFADVCVFRAT